MTKRGGDAVSFDMRHATTDVSHVVCRMSRPTAHISLMNLNGRRTSLFLVERDNNLRPDAILHFAHM